MWTYLELPFYSSFSGKPCLHCLHFHTFFSLLSLLRCDLKPLHVAETVLFSVTSNPPDTKLMDIFQNVWISQISSVTTGHSSSQKHSLDPFNPTCLIFTWPFSFSFVSFSSPWCLQIGIDYDPAFSPPLFLFVRSPVRCYWHDHICVCDARMCSFRSCLSWCAALNHPFELIPSPVITNLGRGSSLSSRPSHNPRSQPDSFLHTYRWCHNENPCRGFSLLLVVKQSSCLGLKFLSWRIPSNLSRHILNFFFCF